MVCALKDAGTNAQWTVNDLLEVRFESLETGQCNHSNLTEHISPVDSMLVKRYRINHIGYLAANAMVLNLFLVAVH